MRTHLYRPGEEVAMCGLDVLEQSLDFRSNCTRDPYEADCSSCKSLYERNVKWYWLNTIGYVPPSAPYETIESGLPGLFTTLLAGA